MFKRHEKNPILKPVKTHDWESRCVFNCAAYYNKGIHIVYRGMGFDQISHFGYAYSKDGYNIEKRLEKPIYSPQDKYETRGVEDPRIVMMNDTVYMTYAGFDGKGASVCMASLPLDKFIKNEWDWKRYSCILPVLPVPDKDDKNAALFPEKINGRYVLLHRIPPDIWISYSEDLVNWTDHKILAKPREGLFDEAKVGAGGPPIKTDKGWLCIYHGVQWKDKENKKGFGIYSLGMMLLDLKNPEKILFRSDNTVLEPAEEYEEQGYVADVVFTCGTVLIGDELFCYYGGADTVICLATAKLNDVLNMKK